MTRRTLAQIVRLGGRVLRPGVWIEHAGGRVEIAPFEGEMHSTAWFNGLIMMVDSGAPVPAAAPAADAAGLMERLPEPEEPGRRTTARIAFR